MSMAPRDGFSGATFQLPKDLAIEFSDSTAGLGSDLTSVQSSPWAKSENVEFQGEKPPSRFVESTFRNSTTSQDDMAMPSRRSHDQYRAAQDWDAPDLVVKTKVRPHPSEREKEEEDLPKELVTAKTDVSGSLIAKLGNATLLNQKSRRRVSTAALTATTHRAPPPEKKEHVDKEPTKVKSRWEKIRSASVGARFRRQAAQQPATNEPKDEKKENKKEKSERDFHASRHHHHGKEESRMGRHHHKSDSGHGCDNIHFDPSGSPFGEISGRRHTPVQGESSRRIHAVEDRRKKSAHEHAERRRTHSPASGKEHARSNKSRSHTERDEHGRRIDKPPSLPPNEKDERGDLTSRKENGERIRRRHSHGSHNASKGHVRRIAPEERHKSYRSRESSHPHTHGRRRSHSLSPHGRGGNDRQNDSRTHLGRPRLRTPTTTEKKKPEIHDAPSVKPVEAPVRPPGQPRRARGSMIAIALPPPPPTPAPVPVACRSKERSHYRHRSRDEQHGGRREAADGHVRPRRHSPKEGERSPRAERKIRPQLKRFRSKSTGHLPVEAEKQKAVVTAGQPAPVSPRTRRRSVGMNTDARSVTTKESASSKVSKFKEALLLQQATKESEAAEEKSRRNLKRSSSLNKLENRSRKSVILNPQKSSDDMVLPRGQSRFSILQKAISFSDSEDDDNDNDNGRQMSQDRLTRSIQNRLCACDVSRTDDINFFSEDFDKNDDAWFATQTKSRQHRLTENLDHIDLTALRQSQVQEVLARAGLRN